MTDFKGRIFLDDVDDSNLSGNVCKYVKINIGLQAFKEAKVDTGAFYFSIDNFHSKKEYLKPRQRFFFRHCLTSLLIITTPS